MGWIELLGGIAIFSDGRQLPTTARKGALAINYGVGSALSRNTVGAIFCQACCGPPGCKALPLPYTPATRNRVSNTPWWRCRARALRP
jgi:hypothetical protein